MTLGIAIDQLADDLFVLGRAYRLVWLLLLASFPCAEEILATPRVEQRDGRVAIANDHLRVLIEDGAVRSVEDVRTGERLLHWQKEEPVWYVEFGRRRVLASPRGEVTVSEGAGRVQVRVKTSIPPPDNVAAVYTVTVGRDPWVEMSIEVENRSSQEIELVGFPANALSAKGPRRYLAYPYQSGVILPLDERFEQMRIYGKLPFVLGYPSNVCSMQWMGMYGRRGGLMLMNTDRYGALKRMGAIDAGQHARLVIEHQASLAPGERYALPAWRMVVIPGGGYRRMCDVYREWVRERTAGDATAIRELVNGVEKVPLQFIPLRHKLDARPQLARAMTTHGYPEHAIRGHPTKGPRPYLPYGMIVSMMESFRDVYHGHLTPQIWTPFSARGWRKFPHSAFLEQPSTAGGVTFPGMSLQELLEKLNESGDPAFLYVNPSFWQVGTPDFDASRMFDRSGGGVGGVGGGSEAGASSSARYVSPSLVQDYMVDQLRKISGTGKDSIGRANGIMFDSSQVFGATLWNNSRLRLDPVSCIDRNPNARYRERYGYLGRDSGVQDKLKTYLALHETTPHAAKVGEWIGEFEPLFLDVNAGSVCLKREFPDTVERPGQENLIPVPLFQMVYGDSQLFVIRVDAASDANVGAPNAQRTIPAEMSRRGSAMFGAIHQVIFWGGVHWAGVGYHRLRGRTWMIVRDNTARRDIFGRRPAYRMLSSDGRETTDIFAVRETSWLDDAGRVIGVHWDNNSGRAASADAVLGNTGVDVSEMWGTADFVPSSLNRLYKGATVTLLDGGSFALWSFSGVVTREEKAVARVADSLPSPEGLAVIWDGRYLSISNELPQARRVNIELTGVLGRLVAMPPYMPRLPDGTVQADQSQLIYSQVSPSRLEVQSGRAVVEVTMPPARPDPDDRPLAVPASLVVFEVAAEGGPH